VVQYCAVSDRGTSTLHEVLQSLEPASPDKKNAMALYYIVQLMHGLWFAEERGITYTAFDGLKSILVYRDSSLKIHDFSATSQDSASL